MPVVTDKTEMKALTADIEENLTKVKSLLIYGDEEGAEDLLLAIRDIIKNINDFHIFDIEIDAFGAPKIYKAFAVKGKSIAKWRCF